MTNDDSVDRKDEGMIWKKNHRVNNLKWQYSQCVLIKLLFFFTGIQNYAKNIKLHAKRHSKTIKY